MPTKKLTDLFVERVKPPARGRVEYFDASFGGLALRVSDGGHKSWSLHFRIGGRLRRYTIGTYPAIKPADARRRAQHALDRLRDGIDPIEEKRAGRLASPARNLGELVRDYLERKKRNVAANTYRVTSHTFDRDILPILGRMSIKTITRADVNHVIDEVLARGSDVHANRVLARLRAFFNWAVERGEVAASPLVGMKLPTKERPRDRVLSDDEMRWLWKACEAVEFPFGPLTKLLLLTAQRRNEVAGMEWPEVDFKNRTWIEPREKTKNDRTHEVQLSGPAIELLRSIPRISENFIFTSSGEKPVSGFSHAKRRLDQAMLAAKRDELGADCDPIPHWTLHDLRRTGATGMARLNFLPHFVDKILNHTSGTIRGVAAVYNRFEYLEERRAALEAWGQFIENLVSPTPSNVVPLVAGQQR
jgi:integrase